MNHFSFHLNYIFLGLLWWSMGKGLYALNAGGMGSIPGWVSKIPHAKWHDQKIKKNYIFSGGIGSIPGWVSKIPHAKWHDQKIKKNYIFFPVLICVRLTNIQNPT